MSIRFPTDLEDRIQRKIDSGRYENETPVLREALQALGAREARIDELRASIADAMASIDRGEGIELTPGVWEEIERDADEQIRLGRLPGPDVLP